MLDFSTSTWQFVFHIFMRSLWQRYEWYLGLASLKSFGWVVFFLWLTNIRCRKTSPHADCRRVVGGISLYCVLLADPLGMLPKVFITVTQVHLKKRPDYTNRSDDRSSSLLSAELTSPLQSAVYRCVSISEVFIGPRPGLYHSTICKSNV